MGPLGGRRAKSGADGSGDGGGGCIGAQIKVTIRKRREGGKKGEMWDWTELPPNGTSIEGDHIENRVLRARAPGFENVAGKEGHAGTGTVCV